MIAPQSVHPNSAMGDCIFWRRMAVTTSATTMGAIWIPDCNYVEITEFGSYLLSSTGADPGGPRLVRLDADDGQMESSVKNFQLLHDLKDGNVDNDKLGIHPAKPLTVAGDVQFIRPHPLPYRVEAVDQNISPNKGQGLGLAFIYDLNDGTETHEVYTWVRYRVDRMP